MLANSTTICWGQSNNITNEIDTKEVIFSSSDKKLSETFERSHKMALSYVHDGNDPVGYW